MHLGMGEILVVLVIALLVFGPNKLPQLGDALGKSIRNFKRAQSEDAPIEVEEKPQQKQLRDGAPSSSQTNSKAETTKTT
jgi:sec-independent protein translocase protein TatA